MLFSDESTFELIPGWIINVCVKKKREEVPSRLYCANCEACMREDPGAREDVWQNDLEMLVGGMAFQKSITGILLK